MARLLLIYEHIEWIDSGIELYRKMLVEQIEVVKKGGEPIGIIGIHRKNKVIEFELSMGQGRFARAAA